jgi:hypothetical protein
MHFDHPLIIQTIRLDPSGSVWTDEALNVSRPDRSGADQIDAEHQATDLALGSNHTDVRWRNARRPATVRRPWVTRAEFPAYGDQAIGRFLAGGPAVPPDDRRMQSWAKAYRGRGRGEVNPGAFPEPYQGALDRRPVGVFLGLNPGQAQLDFQGRWGLFADEIRHLGSYSAWAATWPCHPLWRCQTRYGGIGSSMEARCHVCAGETALS